MLVDWVVYFLLLKTHHILATLYDSKECISSVEGAEYMGIVSQTVNGRECQRWDEQFPHNHTFTDPRYFPENDFNLTSNHCRNPSAGSIGPWPIQGPWCFTTDPETRFEFCGIPKCPLYPECKWTEGGIEYLGTLSQTSNGEACLNWADHDYGLEGNFCRNPNEDPDGPWCFFGAGEDDWEHCDVPLCLDPVKCKDTELGEDYIGTRSITRRDKPCQRWDSQSPHMHDFTDPDLFPDASLEDAGSYCRNPGGTRPGGPWCYTRDPEVPWQYCDIPSCSEEVVAEDPVNPVKHVLHIGLDGLHASCFLNSDSGAKNIMERIAFNGAYTLENARAVLQTVSGPNWASHVCGMDSERSGIVSNAWEAPWMGYPQPITPVTSNRVPLPCAFMYFKGMDENIRTASFMNWRWTYWLGNRGAPGSADVDMSCADMLIPGGAPCDNFVAGNASEYLSHIQGAADRSYTFIHIDLLDGRGHTFGWCGPSYLQGVDMVDGWVGQMLDAIDDDNAQDWLVILSSDHGGVDDNHGGWYDSDLNIPLFMRGPGVKKNYTIESQVSNSDILPTSAWAMGLPGSKWWTGHVIWEAFEQFGYQYDVEEEY